MYTQLNQTSLNKDIFRDLSLAFTAHPATGQLVKMTDDSAIKQSVKRIVLTNHFERRFDPFFGGNIIAQLFENFTPAMISAFEFDIKNAIIKHEPRVSKIVSVDIYDQGDRNAIGVTIHFTPVNRTEPILVDFFIERVR